LNYDVIVVGGGLGGLTAAITAAKRGRKTLLLEKHSTVGGLAAGFTRKGFYFDSGMSRVMKASVAGGLKALGLLDKADLRPHRAVWNVEGQWIEFGNLGEFFVKVAELFPEEKAAFQTFYQKEVLPREKTYGLLFADMTRMGFVKKAAHIFRIIGALPSIGKNLSPKLSEHEVMGRYFSKDGRAFSFLMEKDAEVDYRGEMSFATKVGKWYTQMFNVYPAAGFQGLCDLMAAEFQASGGELRTSAGVRKIVIQGGKAVGVELGKEEAIEVISADNIICCIDLNKALRNLVGIQNLPEGLESRLDKSKLSSPMPILYLGLNLPEARLKECFRGYDEVMLYPSITPAREEKSFFTDHPVVAHTSCFINSSHAPENKSSIQVYLSDPGKEWMNNWGIVDGKRTDSYRQVKKMVIDQVLGLLEKIVPDLSNRSLIEVCELGTPFTIERYTGNTGGSGLGYRLDADYINSKKFGRYFDRCEGIGNLFFAGQQTGYPGSVINAMGSGKHAGKLV
jgi:phytoene dehydrogenase-like protein